MTDRIQHARDWLAAQLQTEAAMTQGPLHVEPAIEGVLINDSPHTVWPIEAPGTDGYDAEGVAVCILPFEDDTDEVRVRCAANAAGIAAARNQHRPLLLIADIYLEDLANTRELNGPDPDLDTAIAALLAMLREAGYTEAER